ncbi:nickel/cobalt transporter [Kaistia dalseonensis]|uniref:Nickel/cobalt efflux system n=1 Tax=Kaistia dalseonensis TaxID=410840 RepID=A0ABU0HCK2_9HYPH|nr:nickel/cobalt transporter [Kaistia dalseonensis]MCX5496854.1 nickel/cobalt transporter [Kaistia dalseonensis]MDQ0439480.1 ABC-type nickel/cobalt efflux system permease component RcnA [Kaistia dalseonensis]
MLVKRLRRLLAALATLLAWPGIALAVSTPFGIATPDGSGSVAWAGPFKGFFLWINAQQASFYRALTSALTHLTESGHAAIFLVALSFAYGVFHAVGPGHGKAVISSYLLVSGDKLKRGVVISFASAFVQAISAIVVVSIGTLVLNVTAVTMTRATDALEIASYTMIAICGAWILWLKATGRGHSHAHAEGTHDHAGHDHHDHDCAVHDHGSSAGFVCDCGHSHAPDPAALDRPLTIGGAWSAILAVGIRPCSGAIIVLVFAISQKLYWAGILSVLFMSLGTGLTVSALATLAVKAKDVALRFSSSESLGQARAIRGVEIAAAAGILVFGLIMLGGALATT